MGRPRGKRRAAVVWNVKLLLYEGEDDDLIRLHKRTPDGHRAAMVKAAMRSGTVQDCYGTYFDDDAQMYETLGELVF